MRKMCLILFSMLFLNLSLLAQGSLRLSTTIHGEKEGDMFSAVDAIGDVNGDGFDDFIVGGNSSGEYVKLYFGGSPFDTLNCIKFLQGIRKRVYASGCGKGDLNGDGYNDFILNTLYDVNDYRVEIYYGGKDKKIYDNPNLTISNNGWYYSFGGRSITGDLNCDGYDDLVITAPNDDYDARGRAYIYFGGQGMDANVDVYLEGDPWDNFGLSSSIVGDVNGDGYDDLLVGAPQLFSEKKIGKAFLFFGGQDIGWNNAIEINPDSTAYEYGIEVSRLGDVDGDGYPDFAIRSWYVDIISGKTLKVIKKITPPDLENWGTFLSVSNGYDFNGDGYNDFILGFGNKGNQYAGGVALYLGSNKLDTVAAFTLNGKTKNSYFGSRLAIGGDINKDGLLEIFIGEDGELTQNGTLGNGTVFIYSYSKLNGIENPKESTIPAGYKLYQNYPNPFNPSTTISYSLTQESDVLLEIYNTIGEKVNTLFKGTQTFGNYSLKWNGVDDHNNNLSSSVYFLRIAVKPYSSTYYIKKQSMIKMMLVK